MDETRLSSVKLLLRWITSILKKQIEHAAYCWEDTFVALPTGMANPLFMLCCLNPLTSLKWMKMPYCALNVTHTYPGYSWLQQELQELKQTILISSLPLSMLTLFS